jgi:hypothetical protein
MIKDLLLFQSGLLLQRYSVEFSPHPGGQAYDCAILASLVDANIITTRVKVIGFNNQRVM